MLPPTEGWPIHRERELAHSSAASQQQLTVKTKADLRLCLPQISETVEIVLRNDPAVDILGTKPGEPVELQPISS
ncbi:MAG: hypothetical protein ACFFGZ_07845 [Candidatus Thorarchaeota archaeon]